MQALVNKEKLLNYLEWLKLIALSISISVATTVAAFGIWWLLK